LLYGFSTKKEVNLLKKLLVFFFVILIFSACGDKGQERINIAVVGRAETPYWDSVRTGAESAGKILGASVKFLSPINDDPAWQINKIEELIDNKVDGIAFAASDPKSIAPVITKAMQADIPCVALDTDVAKSRHLYIGTGNYYAGQEAGQRMISLLDNKGKIAIVGNSSENSDLLQRVMGFRDVLAEYIGIDIATTIDEQKGTIQPSEVESLLKANPDLDGLFCVSDSSGIISGEAVKKSNKIEQVKIVCVGESDDVMSLVRDGIIQTAVARKPYRMGYLGVLALYNMAKVGIYNALMMMPESEIINTGIIVVTPLNIVQYREQLKGLSIKVKF
jgi:ribose transport system substrate-binding protein